MKNLLYFIAFLCCLGLKAQTPTENYIKTITYLAPSTEAITENDTLVTVQYFDGLGRLKQTVQVGAGGQGQDIVTPVVYDAFGRQAKDYLPYAAPTQHGNIHPDPIAELEAFYNVPKYGNTPNPYAEKVFEASPLNRLMEQGAPGAAWAADPLSDYDHTVKLSNETNIDGEVRLFTVAQLPNTPPILESSGFYVAGDLYKTVTKDENWQPEDGKNHTHETFTDKQDRLILKRTYTNSEEASEIAHDTYYVYDVLGNISYVIPPKVNTADGISEEALENLCYQHIYDHRNRLVEKKLPGKGWEYIVYDLLDRPVLTQDAQQRAQTPHQWTFIKYDRFGRKLYSGILGVEPYYDLHNYDRDDMQQEVASANASNLNEIRLNSPDPHENRYYSEDVFPQEGFEIHSVSFYDDYNFDLKGGVAEDIYGVSPTARTRGLSTGSKTRVLGTDQWITTVHYYDEKARPIYTYVRNDHLNTTEKIKHRLDFVGKVLETTTEHTKDGQAPTLTIERFTYDRVGRLLEHTRETNDQPEETLAAHSYDALGQLVQKKVGNTPQAPLQTIDYTYNIRGWLTGINAINAIGSDLFAFDIRYNDPTSGTALYNGNISQTYWRTNNTDNSLKHYTYTYDPLNRITEAIDNTGRYTLSGITYDKNGNLLSLQRQGHLNGEATAFGLMDNLNYIYGNTNQLLQVEDTANDTYGFKDDALNIADTDDDYTYDANGNMISDTNKGITNIHYNYLNLPTEIVFNNDPNQKISYVYTADGIKLQKIVNDNGSITTTDYAGDYIYENGSLKFINHAEGYLQPDGAGGFEYVYQYKDHLGNIRLSYSDRNRDGQISDTPIFEADFESANGWESQGSPHGAAVDAYDNSFSHFGSYAARIDTPEGDAKYVHSNTWVAIDNDQATAYTYSGWAYSDGPGIRVMLFMNTEEETDYYTDLDVFSDYETTNQWVYFEKTVMVPSNIKRLNIRIESFWMAPGHVWFDDIKIEQVGSEIVEESNYYPFGLKHKGYNSTVSGVHYPYGFNGKEENEELGLRWLDFGARNYDKWLGRWMNMDPLAEEFPNWTPYHFVHNNPINLKDPDGRAAMSPIYGTNGEFLGTDDQGLQGKAIVMDAENFTQGMSHDDALKNSKGAEGLSSTEAGTKLLNHYNGLKDRPDYDGFVTVSEGIDWAKANPGALDNPTPDNMLYLDASKLDFGNIKIADFKNGVGESSPINLLNVGNLASSVGNETLRATVYALGRANVNLHNNSGNVSIVNDFNLTSNRATDYDWNTGGTGLRNTLIRAERARAGLNDSHGFRTYYYGTGTLNKPKKPFTPQFPTGPKF